MKVTLVPENFQILDQFPMHLTHFVSRPDYERLIEGINNHLKPVKRANSKQTKQVAVALVLIPFTCGLSALSTIVSTAPVVRSSGHSSLAFCYSALGLRSRKR